MVNRLTLVGRLGKDVELKEAGEVKLAKFSLATDDGFGDKKETDWHNVVVFGKQAEACGKFLKKGAKVYLEGKVKNRSYEKDGATKYYTEVVAHSVKFLDSVKLEETLPNEAPF